MMENKLIPLIIAGGKGSRFWPLSREHCPKQFLCLNGNNSLLQKTMDRALRIAENTIPYIIAGRDQAELVFSSLKQLEGSDYRFIGEPCGRNTAAAVYLACRQISSVERDGVVVVMPADHYVGDIECFEKTIYAASELALEKNSVVLLGTRPTYPAVGYGYAELSHKAECSCGKAFRIHRFKEKPSREKAKKYLRRGNYLWNTGIFIFPLSLTEPLYRYCMPDMVRIFERESSVDAVYRNLEPLSFDHGILERAERVYILETDFGWDDVGSFTRLSSLIPEDEKGNISVGNIFLKDTEKTVVLSDQKLTVTLGVKDLVIAEDHGVLLVCHRDRVEDVREIVGSLEGENALLR